MLNVKDLRNRLGFTQQELADITGIPRDRIAKWEQGKGSPKGYDRETLMGLSERADEIEGLKVEMGNVARVFPAVRYGMIVKKKREKEGLSWELLGNKFNIAPATIEALERGLLDVDQPEFEGLWEWAGVPLSEIRLAIIEEEKMSQRFEKGNISDKELIDPKFHEFLMSNDAFFKNQYTTFNTQVLANLTALQNHARNLEALIKINLEHTGNIEAHQQGVKPDEVHAQINREILAAARVEMDTAGNIPGKG